MQTGAMEPRAVSLKDASVNLLLKINFIFGYFERQLSASMESSSGKVMSYDQMKAPVIASTERALYPSLLLFLFLLFLSLFLLFSSLIVICLDSLSYIPSYDSFSCI